MAIREIRGIREDMKLSAIILTKDGNDLKFKKAVESVSFADEVLVVKEKFPISDFSEVRNRALDRAKEEWVMFLDSDEEVSNELKEEIKAFINKNYNNYKNYNISGIYLKRWDRFLGRWLEYGETANVSLLRLARKDAGHWIRPVHEVWKIKGETGEFKNPLLHYSHDSVEEMVEKIDIYSGIEAEYRSKKQVNRLSGYQVITEMILFPVGKFIQNYILRLGFLDGMAGLIHAGMMSFHSFLVRAKLLTRCESTNTSE